MKRLFLALCLLFCAPALAEEIDRAPKVAARLVAEGEARPGATLWLALEERIRPGWHTYWVNPGEVGGIPTEIDWTLPAEWKPSDIVWPYPKRLPVPALKQMDYGYENKVWLLTKMSVPASARPGEDVRLKAHVSYLVCQNVCVPEEQALELPVKIGTGGPDPTLARDFALARARLPIDSSWPVNFALNKTSCVGKADPDTGKRGTAPCLDLRVAAPSLVAAHPKAVDFFPLESGMVIGDAPMRTGYSDDGLVLRVSAGTKSAAAKALTGVLVLTGNDGSVQALNIKAAPGAVPAANFAPPENGDGATADALPLWLAMLLAAIGGLILNIMPCVLPILAMKALAMARHAGSARKAVVEETLAYAAGAVISFLALGLALVLLRAGGEAVGWGFQMQSPLVVAGFCLLVFVIGLNLSGVFEVGSITAGESLTHKGGAAGAFFTGVLAVAVGAPCTMPVGATAMGFALTQSAATALLVFLALGVGFALPFLILGLVPGALAFVPKPGTWMLRFKQVLAFPMYGAAAFLAWVMTVQTGANGLLFLFAALVTLALAAWVWNATRDLSARGRAIGAIAVILLLLLAGAAVAQLKNATPNATASSGVMPNSELYSAARLEELRTQNRPVFVDATAAWCISCLVNEQTSLSRPSVQQAFAQKKIAYLVADWTNRNPEGTALLTKHGRAGPPLYLYYAPGAAAPAVLPQVLTPSIVLDAIK
ncbi:MAG: thioredoxin family protein [Alphaproteobacteria bacterium]|nr:thioredoxin family protein [Alphaproteobacteria bacterium]